jgi:hypothetical protein
MALGELPDVPHCLRGVLGLDMDSRMRILPVPVLCTAYGNLPPYHSPLSQLPRDLTIVQVGFDPSVKLIAEVDALGQDPREHFVHSAKRSLATHDGEGESCRTPPLYAFASQRRFPYHRLDYHVVFE